MVYFIFAARSLFLMSVICLGFTAQSSYAATDTSAPQKLLKRFASEREFETLMQRWRDTASARQRAMEPMKKSKDGTVALQSQMAPASAPPAPAMAEAAKVGAMADKSESESITNIQTVGVDEGGIVKNVGDYLVILRRGRLFTVRVGGDALVPVSMVDAYAPDASPSGAWYDEMLIAGNTIAVIGYSYQRGGTEIGLFNIDGQGGLSYRATHHLRSNDYYSSRNYASRLIGNKLIFYTPMHINGWNPEPAQFMPAHRRWFKDAKPADFKRILPATKIFRTDDDLDPMQGVALHTVTTCDLSTADMQCDSTAVLGASGRVFYVSAEAVYVWTTQARNYWHPIRPNSGVEAQTMPISAVIRLPLNGTAPSAIKTTGSPIDQLSFLEEAGYLNVLLRSDARGEAMWKAENSQGRLALLRVKIADFDDGRSAAKPNNYQPLPNLNNSVVQNRFIGSYLIYGDAVAQTVAPQPQHGWGRNTTHESMEGTAFALRYAKGDAPQRLNLPHAVERIEAMGNDAILVGKRGTDLQFSSVKLNAGNAQLAGVYIQSNAAQGESRTHGFFYRATGSDKGMLGLPTISNGFNQNRRSESATILFLSNQNLNLTRLGSLNSESTNTNDGCKASCVDWYGNARPIFMGKRVFALLGYELVEGSVRRDGGGEQILEARRVSFAPTIERPNRG